jgi:hypothetical protein
MLISTLNTRDSNVLQIFYQWFDLETISHECNQSTPYIGEFQ